MYTTLNLQAVDCLGSALRTYEQETYTAQLQQDSNSKGLPVLCRHRTRLCQAPCPLDCLPPTMCLLYRLLQENVLAESAMMIPETRQRCEAALRDLKAYAVSRHLRPVSAA